MLGRVVEHVAALAEGGEVVGGVVAGVVVEVRAGEDDVGGAHRSQREAAPDPGDPTAVRSPDLRPRIPPAPVAEMRNVAAVRAGAAFALGAGAAEADRRGQLAPVDRVEPAVVGTDRHRRLYESNPSRTKGE